MKNVIEFSTNNPEAIAVVFIIISIAVIFRAVVRKIEGR